MGGGDLNSKKSWHPNTMKNQERVWKAEQAAAQEKKRIQELQREHAEEKDRFELNSMIKQNESSTGGSNDNRLHWMYDKPDRKVQQEDYLLGKSLEKNYDNVEKQEDSIPAVARRVVGSSMLSSTEDSQVDLARKLREDPLLLVKERERAARAALLNNPLQRKRLTELLRKEQEQKKDHKSKKTKNKDNDLDKQLAAKLNALGGEQGLNLATLLASDNSDSDSSSEEEKSKKKKKKNKHNKQKKHKQSKKKKNDSSNESSDDEKYRKVKQKSKEASQKVTYEKITHKESRKRKSDDSSENEGRYKKNKTYHSDKHVRDDDQNKHTKDYSSDRQNMENRERRESHYRSDQNSKRNRSDRYDSDRKSRGAGLSSQERAAKLAEMAAAGASRELSRGQRVAAQRAAAAAPAPAAATRAGHREARSLPDSLEARIHSNRHYIQRNHRHMDEHFARR